MGFSHPLLSLKFLFLLRTTFFFYQFRTSKKFVEFLSLSTVVFQTLEDMSFFNRDALFNYQFIFGSKRFSIISLEKQSSRTPILKQFKILRKSNLYIFEHWTEKETDLAVQKVIDSLCIEASF